MSTSPRPSPLTSPRLLTDAPLKSEAAWPLMTKPPTLVPTSARLSGAVTVMRLALALERLPAASTV